LTEQDDAQYVMQTISGGYLGYRPLGAGGLFTTDAPDPEHAEHFALVIADL
jgi:hypothetical protein